MRLTQPLAIALAALFLAAWAPALGAQAPGAGPRPMGPGGPGQQMPGVITGIVVNDAGQPVPSASVGVRRDTVLVNGAIAKADGSFRIEGLPPGRYDVRVRAIGFAPIVKAVTITPAAPRVELGNVALSAVATQLSATTVVAEADEAALAPDRNSYTVKDLPAAAGGNTIDVLRNVPGVEVDGDNKVSLRGNQNVVVQINGRATPMRGEQLGNFLAQLTSSMVQRVEVVPNPSAKDDPEGMAGIINIVLKQNADLGTSAGVVVGGGSTGMLNASGNVGHQQGPWTLFASYGFMRDEREMTGFTNRETLQPSSSFLDAVTVGRMYPRSHNATATVEYKLSQHDLLSTQAMFNRGTFDRELDNFYSELDAGRAVTARYDRFTEADNGNGMIDWSATFKRTREPQRRELSSEVRINRAHMDFESAFLDQALNPDGTAANDQPGRQLDDLDETRTDLTLQTDVIRPFGERGKFEFGYKGVLRELDNTFEASTFSYDTDAWEGNAARSNAFNYQDQVHALYAVLSRGIGSFNLQAGLRGEMATSRFDLLTTDEPFENDYTSLYPSALASWDIVPMRQQLKLSYSKRVQRPHTTQMNPFVFREDALNTFQGNPYLKPEYTHSFELGYQHTFARGSLQLTPFYRHTVDAVRAIRRVDEDGVNNMTFANLAELDSYGADANVSFRAGNLNGFGGVNVFRSVSDASNLETDVSNEAVGWSARVNGTYKLTPSLDWQTFFMYRAPMDTEQGRIDAMSMLTLALRHKVFGDRGSVTLRAQDPFNTMKFGVAHATTQLAQRSVRHFGARGVFLSFSYNYGQAPRIRQRPAEQAPADPTGAPVMGPTG